MRVGLRLTLGEDIISVLLVTDDMVLISNSEDELNHQVAKVKKFWINSIWKAILTRLR